MNNINRYIGIPFKDGGDSFEGCDCWGLCRLFYREEYGIDLPDYKIGAMDFLRIRDQIDSELTGGLKFSKIEKAVDPCLILMRLGRSRGLNHIGIYLGADRVLHAYEKTGSSLIHIDSPAWKNLVGGYALPIIKKD